MNSSDLSAVSSSSSDHERKSPSSVTSAAVPSFVSEFPLTPRASRLLRYGELTPGAVLEMLRPEPGIQEGLISSLFYKSDGTPIPEVIRVLQDGGGSSTDALFLVQVRRDFLKEKKSLPLIGEGDWETKLVLKVLKSMGFYYSGGVHRVSLESIALKQLQNLNKVKANEMLTHLDYLKNPNLPRMTFDEASYYYDSGAAFGGKRYFSIIHAARGMPFSKIWEEYSAGNIEREHFLESAYAIGRALGTFHNVTHYVHGDFYWQNIFYDFKSKRVYFIDNESIANSFDNTNLMRRDDFLKFYEHPLFSFESSINECGINKYPLEDLKYLYQAFFDGYVDAYPEDLRSMYDTYIRDQISQVNERVKGVVKPLAAGPGGGSSEGERKLHNLLENILKRSAE
ncbi:MAG: hypothetical protein K2Q34_02155 [Alphaproteobacteria bacterium]|nr:hypothetical protein [Alphaproteobacteria bacterium]